MGSTHKDSVACHHFLAVLLILLPADLRSSPMPLTVPQPAKTSAAIKAIKAVFMVDSSKQAMLVRKTAQAKRWS